VGGFFIKPLTPVKFLALKDYTIKKRHQPPVSISVGSIFVLPSRTPQKLIAMRNTITKNLPVTKFFYLIFGSF
jgi:hypothetical protein